MKQNIGGFVLGLLGGVSGLLLSFCTYLILILILSIGQVDNATIYYVLLTMNIVSNVIALVGCGFYFKKANIGAIFMTIAFIFNIMLFIYILATSSTTLNLTLIFVMIPALFMFIAAVCGFLTKEQQKKSLEN